MTTTPPTYLGLSVLQTDLTVTCVRQVEDGGAAAAVAAGAAGLRAVAAGRTPVLPRALPRRMAIGRLPVCGAARSACGTGTAPCVPAGAAEAAVKSTNTYVICGVNGILGITLKGSCHDYDYFRYVDRLRDRTFRKIIIVSMYMGCLFVCLLGFWGASTAR